METERDAIAQVIEVLRQIVSRSEFIVARSQSPKDVCLNEARSCDIFVGVYKKRYGSIPLENNPEKYSVTEMEYDAAKREGKPILIFVSSDEQRDADLSKFLKKLRTLIKVIIGKPSLILTI